MTWLLMGAALAGTLDIDVHRGDLHTSWQLEDVAPCSTQRHQFSDGKHGWTLQAHIMVMDDDAVMVELALEYETRKNIRSPWQQELESRPKLLVVQGEEATVSWGSTDDMVEVRLVASDFGSIRSACAPVTERRRRESTRVRTERSTEQAE